MDHASSVDHTEVMARSNANLAVYLRHLAACAPDGSFAERAGVLTFAGGHPYPGTYTNGTIRAGARGSASEMLDFAREFFRPLHRGYAIWIRDDEDADLETACRDAELFRRPPLEGNPAIWYAGPPLGVPILPGIDIRLVDNDTMRAEYLKVVLGGYGVDGLPPELAQRVIFSVASLDDPRVAAYAAYRDGVALGGCMVFVDGGVGGLQWAATLPAARGSGIGKALLRACVDAAFAMGADATAGQASQMGLPLWQSLGFDVVGHYRRYLAKPPT
jgi:GNAT superfamily N-acetyltransferase